jgi:hypothetical protein
MTALTLFGRARATGVRIEPTDHGTLRLCGRRPPQALVEELKRHKDDLLTVLRSSAIGADLIPRASLDDRRYAGVDLVARGRNVAMLRIGTARLALTPDDLSPALREVAERIAYELRMAGPEADGRWATDVVHAYGEAHGLLEPLQVAAYHAWSSALEMRAISAGREQPPPAAA